MNNFPDNFPPEWIEEVENAILDASEDWTAAIAALAVAERLYWIAFYVPEAKAVIEAARPICSGTVSFEQIAKLKDAFRAYDEARGRGAV